MTLRPLPLVGIGLPVYNGGRFLARTIESLLTQTFGDFELVISDNASTDDTEAVCRDYARRDARIHYVRQSHNIGANPNFNAVRRLARGRYFKWASANDRCEPSFLAECTRVLADQPDVVLAYSGTRLIDEADRLVEDYRDPLEANQPSPVARFVAVLDHLGLNNAWNGVVRADALAAVGPVKRYLGSDVPLMAALALRGRLHRVPEYLFLRRIGPTSHTAVRQQRGDLGDYGYDEEATHLKQLRDYAEVVARGPLSVADKMRLTAILLRRAAWQRRVIAAEALHALRSGLSRAARRGPTRP